MGTNGIMRGRGPWAVLLLCVLLMLALAGCAEPQKVRDVSPFEGGVNTGFWTFLATLLAGILYAASRG